MWVTEGKNKDLKYYPSILKGRVIQLTKVHQALYKTHHIAIFPYFHFPYADNLVSKLMVILLATGERNSNIAPQKKRQSVVRIFSRPDTSSKEI